MALLLSIAAPTISTAASSCFDSQQDPIPICTCSDLNQTRDDLSANYELQNNIDCSDTENWNSGDGWDAIGNYSSSFHFTGTFDGQGYNISELFSDTNGYAGVFAYLEDATVKDVHVRDIDIDFNSGGESFILGGAIAGRSVNSRVHNSSSTGTIFCPGEDCGGLVGENDGEINLSYSSVNVTVDAFNNGGGLVGENLGDIRDSYAHGNVTSQGDDTIGGLVGSLSGTVNRSYSTGELIDEAGSTTIGGLVGSNSGTVANSFWDNETSGQASSAGGTGKTTSEMKDVATYTDTATDGLSNPWDFYGNLNDDTASEDIWGLESGTNNGYPDFGVEAPDPYSLNSCQELDTPGRYTLNEDITDNSASACFNITANDVTLNCNSHTVDGDRSGGRGVYVTRSGSGVIDVNITVRNCTFSDWTGRAAIDFDSDTASYEMSNTDVYDTNLYDNVRGVFIIPGGGTVADTEFINNSQAGIQLDISGGVVSGGNYTRLYFENNSVGFRTSDYIASTLSDSTLVNNTQAGVYLGASGTIFDFTLENTTIQGSPTGVDMNCDSSCDQLNISANDLTDNEVGISYTGTSVTPTDFLIYNNLFNNTQNTNFTDDNDTLQWNTTTQAGDRIYSEGPQIGGNYWAKPDGTGYSQTCTDADTDGFCDTANTLNPNNTDYHPLSNQYNIAPDKPSLNSPADDATGVSTDPTLNVTVTDPDSDAMDVTFYNVSDNSQIGSTQTSVSSGESASVTWTGLNHHTSYQWYTNITDGLTTIQSDTWNFTTVRDLPTYSDFDGATTDFTSVADLSATTLLLENTSYGKIFWHNAVDVRNQDFNDNVSMGEDWIDVNSDQLDTSLNSSANLTIYNSYRNPVIRRDGEPCNPTTTPACHILEIAGSKITFNVTQFSNYSAGDGPFFNDSWNRRLNVTINSSEVPKNITDFKVYVNLSDLPIAFFDNVQDDGDDIRVTDVNNTLVPQDLVTINTTAETGELHFEGTVNSSTNRTYLIYFDNPFANPVASDASNGRNNVWNDTYGAVWHLQENGTGTVGEYVDSTGNGNDGQGGNGNTSQVPIPQEAQLHTGQQFTDTTGEHITVPYDDSIEFALGDRFSISFWGNFTGDDNQRHDLIQKTSYNPGWGLRLTDWNDEIEFVAGGDTTSIAGSSLQDGSLHLGHALFDTQVNRTLYYEDAGQVGNVSINPSSGLSTSDFAVEISDPDSTDSAWNGLLDEIRVAKERLSESWMTAEYNNQDNATTFYSVGSVEVNTVNTEPQHDQPKLNATDHPSNTTAANLTAYAQNVRDVNSDNVSLTFDWRENGTSIAGFLASFNTNNTSTQTGVIRDYTTYQNNATLGGGNAFSAPTWKSDCVIGGCYDFNGTADGINATNDTSVQDVINYTAAAWINIDSNDQGDIMGRANSGNGAPIWQLRIDGSNHLEAYVDGGDGAFSKEYATTATLPSDTWIHAAFTYQNNTLNLYIDGEQQDVTKESDDDLTGLETNYENIPLQIGNEFDMGQFGASGSAAFDGQIDEPRFYQHALPQQQIKQLYQEGQSQLNGFTNRTSTLVSQETTGGTNYSTAVTPSDGEDRGTTKTTNNITLVTNGPPTHDTPVLNATDHPDNRTTANLTVYSQNLQDPEGENISVTYDWRLDDTSIALLNMPFNTNISTTAIGAVKDYTTNKHSGTLGGGSDSQMPAWNTSGVIGGTYTFDGTDDYIQTDINLNDSRNITISYWFKADQVSSTFNTALWQGNESGNGGGGEEEFDTGVGTRTYDGQDDTIYAHFEVDKTGTGGDAADDLNLHKTGFTDTENWHHVVITVEGFDTGSPSGSLYVDNVLEDTDTAASAIPTDNWDTDLRIGQTGSGRYFDGKLDQVQVYNRSLSSQQIAQLYREGNSSLNNFTNRTNTLVSQETTKGDTYTVDVTPSDGNQDGTTRPSNTLTIQNTPPTHDTPELNATDHPDNRSTANLTAYARNVEDVNSDNTSLTYDWRENGTSLALLNLPFNGNITSSDTEIKDYTTYQNNATNHNMESTTGGVSGNALTANGTGPWIEHPEVVNMTGHDNWAVSMWFNLAELPSNDNDMMLWKYTGTGNTGGAFLYVNNNGDTIDAFNGGLLSTNYAVSTDTWYHVVGVKNGSEYSIYVNGTEQASSSSYDFTEGGSTFHSFQSETDAASGNGSIDEIRVYNRTLSDQQIEQIYREGQSQLNGFTNRTSTLLSQETQEQDIWSVAVTPHDEEDAGQTKTTSSLEIQNTPPTHDTPKLNATDHPQNGSNANLTTYAQNLQDINNNDNVSLTFDWRESGTSIANLNMPFNTNVSTTDTDAVKDYTTYQNNATLGGGSSSQMPAWTADGVVGGTYDFDGSDDVIRIPHSSSTNITGDTFTLAAWVYPTGIGCGDFNCDDGIISKAHEGTSNVERYHLGLDSAGAINVRRYSGSLARLDTDTTPVVNNKWQHLAGVYNGTHLVAYYNGEEIDNLAATGDIDESTEDLLIGKRYNNRYYQGKIDEILVYNDSLSKQQIQQLFEEGNSSLNGFTNRTSTLVSQETTGGDNLTAAVTPSDGKQDGTTKTSNSLLVVNTPPTHDTPVLNATDHPDNRTTANLSVNAQNLQDGDNDNIAVTYDWRENGTSLALLNLPFNTNVSTTDTDAVKDYTTYQNNATLGNGTTGTAPVWKNNCVIGGCYDFDGDRDHIEVSNSTDFDLTGNFTLSTWVRYESGTDPDILTKGAFDESYSIWYWENEDAIRFAIDNDRLSTPTDSMSPSQWHHVVAVREGDERRVYIDGTLSASDTYSQSISTVSGPLTISSADWAMDGQIDEVRIYNYSLSGQQIQQQFSEGNRNLNNQDANTNSTLVSQETQKGDTYTVDVTPSDGNQDGTTRLSNSLTVQNSPPTHTTPLLNSSGEDQLSSENLTVWAQSLSDANEDSIALAYDWRENNTSIANLNMPFNHNISTNDTDAIPDYTTYRNNGTLGDGNTDQTPVWNESCVIGGCYDFDGDNDVITADDDPTLDITGEITLSAWINMRSQPSFSNIITKTPGGTANYGLQQRDGGNLSFFLEVDGSVESHIANTNLQNDKWYHVAATFNESSDTVKIYVNGSLKLTSTETGSMSAASYPVVIGAARTGGFEPWDGFIDEPKILNHTLSQQQIRQMFREGNSHLNGHTNRTSTLVSQETQERDIWSVAVTPSDKDDDGTTLESNSLTLPNTDIACGDTLTGTNQLTGNLSCPGQTALHAGEDDLTLNCNGHWIQDATEGFSPDGFLRSEVKQCTFFNNTNGIETDADGNNGILVNTTFIGETALVLGHTHDFEAKGRIHFKDTTISKSDSASGPVLAGDGFLNVTHDNLTFGDVRDSEPFIQLADDELHFTGPMNYTGIYVKIRGGQGPWYAGHKQLKGGEFLFVDDGDVKLYDGNFKDGTIEASHVDEMSWEGNAEIDNVSINKDQVGVALNLVGDLDVNQTDSVIQREDADAGLISVNADSDTDLGNIEVRGNDSNNPSININGDNATLANLTLNGTSTGIDVNAATSTVLEQITSLLDGTSLTATSGAELTVVDSSFTGYDLTDTTLTVKESQYGTIAFSSAVTQTGDNLSSDIQIGQDWAYVNSSQTGLNQSANVTLTGTYGEPVVFKDDESCTTCHIRSQNSTTVTFNVTGWSNHSIENKPTHDPPILNATDHPDNKTTANLTAYARNISDEDGDNVSLTYDWRLDDTSIALLNMPFNTNVSTTDTDAVKDYTTYQNNGTLGNGTTGTAPVWKNDCVIGGCYTFDSLDDVIEIPDAPELTPNQYTMSAWFNVKGGGSTGDQDIIHKGNGNDFISMNFNEPEDAFRCNIRSSSTTYAATDDVAIAENTWHHGACVFDPDSNELRAYLNGTLINTTDVTGVDLADTSEPLRIGRTGNPTDLDAFNGSIDEPRMYDRVFSQEQIQQLFEEGNSLLNGFTNRTSTLVSQETTAGDNYTVAVTPQDGLLAGTTKTSNHLRVRLGSTELSDTVGFTSTTPSSYSGFRNQEELFQTAIQFPRTLANSRLAAFGIDLVTAATRNIDRVLTVAQELTAGTAISRLFTGGRDLAETYTFAEIVESTVDNLRTITDTFGTSDSITRSFSSQRIKDATYAVATQLSRTLNIGRITQDTLSFIDTITRTATSQRISADTFTLTTDALNDFGINRVVTTTLNTATTITRSITGTRTLTDTFAYTTDSSTQTIVARLLEDTFTYTTDTTIQTTVERFLANNYTLATDTTTQNTFLRTLTDTYAYNTDTVVQTLLNRVQTTTFTIGSTVLPASDMDRTTTDTFASTTDLTAEVDIRKLVTETMTFLDSVSRSLTGTRILADTFTAQQDTATGFIGFRTVTETFAYSDAIATGQELIQTVTETFTYSSQETPQTTGLRQLTDTFTATTSMFTAAFSDRLVTDTFAYTTDTDVQTLLNRLQTDTFAFTTDILQQTAINKVVTDTITQTLDTATTFTGGRTLADTFAYSSTISTGQELFQTLTETLAYTSQETRQTTGLRQLTDTFTAATDQITGFSLDRFVTVTYQYTALTTFTGATERLVTSSFTYLDQLSTTFTGERLNTETYDFTDTPTSLRSFSRSIIQIFQADNSMTRTADTGRVFTGMLSYRSTPDRSFTGNRLMDENIAVATSISFSKEFVAYVSDTFSTDTTIGRTQTLGRVFTGMFSFQDILDVLFPDTGGDNQEDDSDSSGGGGGGGGGFLFPDDPEEDDTDTETGEPGIRQRTDDLLVRMEKGETRTVTVDFENNGSAIGSYDVTVSGVTSFLGPDENTYTLVAGQQKTTPFDIRIPQDQEPGVYQGSIRISVGDKHRTVPVTLIVESEDEELLDVKLSIDDPDNLLPDAVGYGIEVYNLGQTGRVDIELAHTLYNETDAPVWQQTETIAVETSAIMAKKLDTRLNPGTYRMETVARYGKRTANASQTFNVRDEPQDSTEWPVGLILTILGIVSIAAVLLHILSYTGKQLSFPPILARVRNAFTSLKTRIANMLPKTAKTAGYTPPTKPSTEKLTATVTKQVETTPEYTCQTCGKHFDSVRSLYIHNNTEHGDE